MSDRFERMLADIETGQARAGVIGLGYVGLPLAIACAEAGFNTIGYDIDITKSIQLAQGISYITDVPQANIQRHLASGRFRPTSDTTELAKCDVLIVCVPTPLTAGREPDLTYLESTAVMIADIHKPGALIVIESTSFPGTTREIVCPKLSIEGRTSGTDFYLAFSPERIDPGRTDFDARSTPKIISGDGKQARSLAAAFYRQVVSKIVEVSSVEVAEATKITENVFRAINIALVNELKVIFDRMDIDVWEVIEAAATKPFGYMPFYPGPGLGGHCIPVDPFYLAWKAREVGNPSRLIELAGEINHEMPQYVLSRLAQALGGESLEDLKSKHVLILGLSYKKDVSDTRESPALWMISALKQLGAQVGYHDPLVPEIPLTRAHGELAGIRSAPLSPETVRLQDAVIICTDHSDVDYQMVSECASVLIDTRNVITRLGLTPDGLTKA